MKKLMNLSLAVIAVLALSGVSNVMAAAREVNIDPGDKPSCTTTKVKSKTTCEPIRTYKGSGGIFGAGVTWGAGNCTTEGESQTETKPGLCPKEPTKAPVEPKEPKQPKEPKGSIQ